jgi:hypothetical protein
MNTRIRSIRRAVGMIDLLESRRLLSTINWTNKGTGAGAGDTDDFNAIYGGNATVARNIVQRAIDDWEAVLVNFNGSGGRNTFTLTLSAVAFAGGLRGQTGSVVYDALDKPQSAVIDLDDNGGGSGWYFDPTPGTAAVPDDSEFTTLVTPFDADAPGVTGFDFYRTTLHELGHAMGLASSAPRITSVEVNAGVDPVNAGASLRTVTTGGITYTLTTDGGRHFFEGGGAYAGPTHPNELMNAGRAVPSGTRRLISNVNAIFLRDLYNYTVTLPSQLNSFYVNLNTATNAVVVSGDIDFGGDDVDLLDIEVSGSNAVFQMNGYQETIAGAQFTSITVNMGVGNDDVDVNGLLASKTVTINGGNDNDRFDIAVLDDDIDTDLDSNFTVNGGSGTDSLFFFDSADAAGGDDYTITTSVFTKNASFINRQVTYLSSEQLNLFGSNQPTTYNLDSLLSGVDYNINGGTGNDTFNVGNDDYDNNQNSDGLAIDGNAGTDVVNVSDTLDTADDSYLVSGFAFEKTAADTMTMPDIERFNLTANNSNNFINVPQISAGFNVSVNAGDGNDTITTGFDDLDNNILAGLTITGGAGTDSLTFEDNADGIGSDIVTIASTSVDKPLLSNPISFFTMENVLFLASPQSDTINITGVNSLVGLVVNAGNGNDTITNGTDLNSQWLGNATINGGGGTDSIALDDSGDLTATAYTLTATTFRVSAGFTTETFVYGTMEAFSWLGGDSARDFIATSVNIPTTLNGGTGNDTFTIGGGDFDSNINADVRTSGGTGTDLLVVNDSTDNEAILDTYTITGSSFTKSSAAGASISYGNTLLFAPPVIDQMILNASGLDSVINVNSTGSNSLAIFPAVPTLYPVPTTINGSGGTDRINIAAGNIGSIRGNISVNGGAGLDQLTVDNAGVTASGDTTTVTHNSLTNTAWDYALTFSAHELFILEAGTGNDTVNFNATAAGPTNVFLNGNNGADVFNIIEGTATVRGGAGLDDVIVNSTQAGTAGVVFDNDQDLDLLHTFVGGTTTIVPNGNIQIDADSLGTLRGTLNINDNTVIARTTAESFLVPRLTQGYNAGNWNGLPGVSPLGAITSGTAAATTRSDGIGYATIGAAAGQLNQAVFQGVNVVAGNFIMTATIAGDTDLDRDVDFNDLLSHAQNYNFSPRNWNQGNFNYDAGVDFNDLLLLAQNYNQVFLTVEGDLPSLAASRLVPSASPRRSVLGSLSEDAILA